MRLRRSVEGGDRLREGGKRSVMVAAVDRVPARGSPYLDRRESFEESGSERPCAEARDGLLLEFCGRG